MMPLFRNTTPARPGRLPAPGTAFLILFTLLWPAATPAEQQISREDYVAQSHEGLLAPCHNDVFVQCLGTTENTCVSRVNRLVKECSDNLPAMITESNFDEVADEYASCIFGGLQRVFDKSSEQIGQCETQANLR